MEESPADTSTDTSSSNGSDTYSDTYDSIDPGLCVIMDNTIFVESSHYYQRKKDSEDLDELFTGLGFTVMIHNDLTAEEMKSTAEGYSRMTHSGVFFLIILSHGEKGGIVYGTDGKIVVVEQLKELFNAANCPSLIGTPKIFMTDACRGNTKIHCCQSKAATKYINRSTDSNDVYTIFASSRGRSAGIDSEPGSRLIKNFVTAVNRADHNRKFEEIMTEMKGCVHKIKMQNGVFETKDYYIKKYQANDANSQHQALQKRFIATVHSWLPVRKETTRQVNKTEKNLKYHHCNCSIARAFGSFAFIAFTAAIILSIISPSYMLNVHVYVPLIVLAGVDVPSVITVIGASIAEKAIENEKLNEVQKQLDDDRLQVKVIQQMAKNIQKSSQATRQVDSSAATTTQAVTGAIQINTIDMKVVMSPARTLLEIGAEFLRIGGRAVLGLVIDSITITYRYTRDWYSFRKGSWTQASKKLNKLNVELKKQMLKIKRATQLYNIQRIMYE